MPIFVVRTELISHPVYKVAANTEEEAQEIVDAGGLDPVEEQVSSETVLSINEADDEDAVGDEDESTGA